MERDHACMRLITATAVSLGIVRGMFLFIYLQATAVSLGIVFHSVAAALPVSGRRPQAAAITELASL